MANPINLKSFKEFLKSGSLGGIILLGCVLISLSIANSDFGPAFENLLETKIGKDFGPVHLTYPILLWINDGLMAIFFLLVGLEIKRELVEGELSTPAKAILPIVAALGGVAAPALIYHFFNSGTETSIGWGIPMATDIAFALAIVTLMGKKVPASLKIFLAALAIADDLMAILVIAIFYTTELHVNYLLFALGALALPVIFNRLRVKNLAFYLIPGVFAWYFIHHSGIHATIAGVLTAMTLPTTPDNTESPLEKLEHILVNPVNFVIMPLFALANTNILIEASMLEELFTPLGLGILLGLFLGKPIGISLATWISVKSGICRLPAKASWLHIVGVGMLGGIGFTMSIFIAMLSFADSTHLASEAKFAVLIASVLSGVFGAVLLSLTSKRTRTDR